ncbi:hypothetical protein [Limisalsivibrio acetivorans]|uniref:hypothetical protein n=1 Tax=Limisalsivibrio acetivorans TaxID=1304888 RepID=UPI0003B37E2E|nr:hypothetical protein [Limisalsivibrio acetivorans]
MDKDKLIRIDTLEELFMQECVYLDGKELGRKIFMAWSLPETLDNFNKGVYRNPDKRVMEIDEWDREECIQRMEGSDEQ